MSSGERPIGTAKGTQSDTEALYQPPPPLSIPRGAGGGPSLCQPPKTRALQSVCCPTAVVHLVTGRFRLHVWTVSARRTHSFWENAVRRTVFVLLWAGARDEASGVPEDQGGCPGRRVFSQVPLW